MDPREKNDEAVLPLTGHLEEFRRRLIYCLIALTLASGASYAYIEDIIAFISAPAGKLYFMQPAEVFFSYLHTAVFTGFLVTMPCGPSSCGVLSGRPLRTKNVTGYCFLYRQRSFSFMAEWPFRIFWSFRQPSSFSWIFPVRPCSPCFPCRRTFLFLCPLPCLLDWPLNCPWSF